jgi:hypothetical protein
MLFQLAIFVPFLNLNEILHLQLVNRISADCGGTYANDKPLLHQTRHLSRAARFILSCSSAPYLAGFLICGDIEGFEGDLVGFQDRLEAGGSCDDVG